MDMSPEQLRALGIDPNSIAPPEPPPPPRRSAGLGSAPERPDVRFLDTIEDKATFLDPKTNRPVRIEKSPESYLGDLLDQKADAPPQRRLFGLLPGKGSTDYEAEIRYRLDQLDQTEAHLKSKIDGGKGDTSKPMRALYDAQDKIKTMRGDLEGKLDEVTGVAGRQRTAATRQRRRAAVKTAAKWGLGGALANELLGGVYGGMKEVLTGEDTGEPGTVLDRLGITDAASRVLYGGNQTGATGLGNAVASATGDPNLADEAEARAAEQRIYDDIRLGRIDPAEAGTIGQQAAIEVLGEERYGEAQRAAIISRDLRAVAEAATTGDQSAARIMGALGSGDPMQASAAIAKDAPFQNGYGDLYSSPQGFVEQALKTFTPDEIMDTAFGPALGGPAQQDPAAMEAPPALGGPAQQDPAAMEAPPALDGVEEPMPDPELGAAEMPPEDVVADLESNGLLSVLAPPAAAGTVMEEAAPEGQSFGEFAQAAQEEASTWIDTQIQELQALGDLNPEDAPALVAASAAAVAGAKISYKTARWLGASRYRLVNFLVGLGATGAAIAGGSAGADASFEAMDWLANEFGMDPVTAEKAVGSAGALYGATQVPAMARTGIGAARSIAPTLARRLPLAGALFPNELGADDELTPEMERRYAEQMGLSMPPAYPQMDPALYGDEGVDPAMLYGDPGMPTAPTAADITMASPQSEAALRPSAPQALEAPARRPGEVTPAEAVAEIRRGAAQEPNPSRVRAGSGDGGLASAPIGTPKAKGGADPVEPPPAGWETDAYGAPGTFQPSAQDADMGYLTGEQGATPTRESGKSGKIQFETAEPYEPTWLGGLLGVTTKDEERQMGLALLATGGQMMSRGVGPGVSTFADLVMQFDAGRKQAAQQEIDDLQAASDAAFERGHKEEGRRLERKRLELAERELEFKQRPERRELDAYERRIGHGMQFYLNDPQELARRYEEEFGTQGTADLAALEALPPDQQAELLAQMARRLVYAENRKRANSSPGLLEELEAIGG